MPGLDPGIHSTTSQQAETQMEWIAGSSPAMTRSKSDHNALTKSSALAGIRPELPSVAAGDTRGKGGPNQLATGEVQMKLSTLVLSAVAAAALAVSAVALPTIAKEMTVEVGGAPMYPSKNIIQNAVSSKDHTTLVAAVKAAGLVDTLQGPGPF